MGSKGESAEPVAVCWHTHLQTGQRSKTSEQLKGLNMKVSPMNPLSLAISLGFSHISLANHARWPYI